MARRKPEEPPENRERWLVSYADFITLLFAFFVVMYAISSVNEGKYKILSDALGSEFGAARAGQPGPDTIPLITPQQIASRKRSEAIKRERIAMTQMARNLQKVLAPLEKEGKVRVTQGVRGVSVEINASVLFAPGEARLSPESDQTLRLVATVMSEDEHAIQVEGHTDNLPIANALFASNWELSSARASAVVRLFIEAGVDEKRMSAVGHAATRPVADNNQAEGRARNRRVNITILTGIPDQVVEVPTSGPLPAVAP
ncbi:flagellar motor protein MotD [Massilia sp. W12]|uniref:flagellar motor protein MotD n=1 Tax=Massilia sp. W12 TaxID=3126507 RepID=UPI0030D3DFD6